MNDLVAARSQMAMSLGFHILFAVVGIGMPALMVIAEYRYQKHGDPLLKELAKRWAFSTEAIFLGIYLCAWDRISPRAHLAAGVAVAISGAMSGVFVVTANAWMNAPTGFDVIDG